MFSFKKSLIAAVALSSLMLPLSPVGAASDDKEKEPRKFYLTKTTHDGSQALSACAEGYHMASLWEIFDPSNLRYDTQLGTAADDSGSGPPSLIDGWIRTGVFANGINTPGAGNCQAWTSVSDTDRGSTVSLNSLLTSPEAAAGPWFARTSQCNGSTRVWCVQD